MSFRRFRLRPELAGAVLFIVITAVLISGASGGDPRPPALTLGPLVGKVTTTSAYIWVRANRPVQFWVRYTRVGGGRAAESAPVRLGPDFNGVAALHGLEPDTEYRYTVVLEGAELPPVHKQVFRTAPLPGMKGVVRIALGGGLGSANQPVWDALQSAEPDLFILTGNGTALNYRRGASEIPQADEIRYVYRAARSDERFRRFTASTPTLAMWSDLDFGRPGANGKLAYKQLILELFQEYWANGTYGYDGTSGIWQKVSYGQVDLFLLDGRYNQSPGKSMLGPEQFTWLLEELARSKATFKVLVSDPIWNPGYTADDAWSAYPLEYARLTEFLQRNNIKGVVLASGGVQGLEVNRLPDRSPAYPLYELVAGNLAAGPGEDHCSTPVSGRTACYSAPGFAFVTANTEVSPPALTLQLLDVSGSVLTQQVLAATDLGYEEGEAEAAIAGYAWQGTTLDRPPLPAGR